MGQEIERKFLISGDGWRKHAGKGAHCIQGYLHNEPGRTMRVRIKGHKAYLTIKGETHGAARPEYEYPIPLADARELLRLCPRPWIEKARFVIPCGALRWEIDEFARENRGLVVAEIELRRENQRFERPPWIGREVTSDPRYANAALSKHPFRTWRSKS